MSLFTWSSKVFALKKNLRFSQIFITIDQKYSAFTTKFIIQIEDVWKMYKTVFEINAAVNELVRSLSDKQT